MMQDDTNSPFAKCAQSLESKGYGLLRIPDNLSSCISKAFLAARVALDDVSANMDQHPCNDVPLIDPKSSSSSWTGYHQATSLNGRYNRFREGFVFSNGEMFEIEAASRKTVDSFASQMNELFHIMHDVIANGILEAIEKILELPDSYFRNKLGPTDVASQWHLKRYNILSQQDSIEDSCEILLPMHTDPSLISVVILDQTDINLGCMGLQVLDGSEWKEITHHGHRIAVIFVGSVLSHLVKSQSQLMFPAAKHRVARWWSDDTNECNSRERVAATLFVRPHGNALMKPFHITSIDDADESDKKYQTFSEWNERIARNYMKKRRKNSMNAD